MSYNLNQILCLDISECIETDVMKFHHLGQHLLDTNCLLLILKMFGLQEVSTTVVSKADSPENKFVVLYSENLVSNVAPQLFPILSIEFCKGSPADLPGR